MTQLRSSTVVLSIALAALLGACQGKDSGIETTTAGGGERKVLFYRSPMDPSFISEKPGKDGMGMDLVPVFEGDPEADLRSITVQGAFVQKMGIRVAEVRRGRPTRLVRAVGQVEFDETRVSHVNMKFDGWIERLWVDETGQFVKRGAPLFSVYSPELVASQEEYLQTRRAAAGGPHAEHIVNAARRRLRQFDVPEGFVDEIEREGHARRNVVIRAPSSGYVLHKNAFAGTRVKMGADLFTLADLDALWVMADVYEFDAPWVTVGQEATVELDYLPGRVEQAKVDYVYPVLDEKARTIKIRVVLPNPGVVLKPGMFATVRIHTQPSGEVLLVPSEAVLLSGERAIAFVTLGDGRFEPRQLELGVRGDEYYGVLEGLAEGERVVVSGQFLLDSESRLKEAVLKMLGGNLAGKAGAEGAGAANDMKDMPGMDSMKTMPEEGAAGTQAASDMADMPGMAPVKGKAAAGAAKQAKPHSQHPASKPPAPAPTPAKPAKPAKREGSHAQPHN